MIIYFATVSINDFGQTMNFSYVSLKSDITLSVRLILVKGLIVGALKS